MLLCNRYELFATVNEKKRGKNYKYIRFPIPFCYLETEESFGSCIIN